MTDITQSRKQRSGGFEQSFQPFPGRGHGGASPGLHFRIEVQHAVPLGSENRPASTGSAAFRDDQRMVERAVHGLHQQPGFPARHLHAAGRLTQAAGFRHRAEQLGFAGSEGDFLPGVNADARTARRNFAGLLMGGILQDGYCTKCNKKILLMGCWRWAKNTHGSNYNNFE